MEIDIPPSYNSAAYVFNGELNLGPGETPVKSGRSVKFGPGSTLTMSALSEGTGGRFLLLAGDSLEEPVAWHGPLVMNTQEEIATAVDDYRSGRMGRIQRGM